MALTKWTMIFNYSSGITPTNSAPVRQGGWSESVYTLTGGATLEAEFLALISARLSICPRGTSVTRYRIQEVDPAGPSTPRKVQLSAPGTWLSDVPQMALKVSFGGGTAGGAFRREFRGLPDVQVVTGEYQPTAPFVVSANAFFARLQGSSFRARRRDKTKKQFKVSSISAAGLVTMIDATEEIAAGSRVQILRTIDPATGRRKGYFATITNFVDDRHFTISGEKVIESNFGTLRAAAIVTAAFSSPDLANAEAVVRKVGRPFRAYSGRASKRA